MSTLKVMRKINPYNKTFLKNRLAYYNKQEMIEHSW